MHPGTGMQATLKARGTLAQEAVTKKDLLVSVNNQLKMSFQCEPVAKKILAYVNRRFLSRNRDAWY